MKISEIIKKVIMAAAPYYFVRKYYNLRSASFIPVLEGKSKLLETVESRFKVVVSVQGIGFSGAGAVNDYLREFSDGIVFGSETGVQFNGEIDFLRHSGGLFEIEKYINSNNVFQKDALIKRFKLLSQSTYLFKTPRAKELVNQFYNALIDFEIDTRGHRDYNSYLTTTFCKDTNIQIMKDMSVKEYRQLCRSFIASLFNVYYKEGKSFIVFDQLCADFDYDFKRDCDYIPNLKQIIVFRDPRDVYVFAKRNDVSWIEHDHVDNFVKWYKHMIRGLSFDSEEYLVVRFENLILDYEKETTRINSYLGLCEKNHNNKLKYLNPSVSIKNVGIWKSNPQFTVDFSIIQKNLSYYCYNA